jgi:hypothetical protein
MVRAWRSAIRAGVGAGHARPARLEWALRLQSERELGGALAWIERWSRKGRSDGARLARRQPRGREYSRKGSFGRRACWTREQLNLVRGADSAETASSGIPPCPRRLRSELSRLGSASCNAPHQGRQVISTCRVASGPSRRATSVAAGLGARIVRQQVSTRGDDAACRRWIGRANGRSRTRFSRCGRYVPREAPDAQIRRFARRGDGSLRSGR